MKKIYLTGIIIATLLTAFAIFSFNNTKRVEAGGEGSVATKCNVSQSSVTIGDDISTNVLSTTTRRAWARVSLANNATNTVSVRLNDVSAVHNTGILLNAAVAGGASTTPMFEFGLNTDMPYVGAVKAITNLSTTTLLITECVY